MPINIPGYTEGEDALFSASSQSESQLTPVGGNHIAAVKHTTGPVPPEITEAGGGGGGGGGGGESDPTILTGLVSLEEDPLFDSATKINAAISPEGTWVENNLTAVRLIHGGTFGLGTWIRVHPSVSASLSARGGVVFQPFDNIQKNPDWEDPEHPEKTTTSLFHFDRDTSDFHGSLAWAPEYGGFNVDWRTTTQAYPIHTFRTPNPDPHENPFDPDPEYAGNKDYVAGFVHHMDLMNGPGTGWLCEAGNGRAEVQSARALNHTGAGWDMGGNDIVFHGHWASGGNKSHGTKVGAAAGFLAVTGNMWGNPNFRGMSNSALFINQRRSFSVAVCVINDFVRLDGGDNFWRGGVFTANTHATHDENFTLADGIAIDVDADGGNPDPGTQAYYTTAQYRTAAFMGNIYHRTTRKVGMTTWMNPGGSLDGFHGTAYHWLHDTNDGAAINVHDPVNTEPNCRPWTFDQDTFVTNFASKSTELAITAHGLRNRNKVCLYTTGTLPAPLVIGRTYFIDVKTVDAVHLRKTPDGANITLTSDGTGTHSIANMDSSPYNTRGDSSVNYIRQDAGQCEIRLGAAGRNNPGHTLINIAEGDNAYQIGREGIAFTFSRTNESVYALHAADHGLADGDVITLDTTGSLPGGLPPQAAAIILDKDNFQVATNLGQDVLTTTAASGSGTHSFNTWMPKYQFEAGNKTVHSGVPTPSMLWGAIEHDCAVSYRPDSYTRAAVGATGSHYVVNQYEPYRLFFMSGVSDFQITLPGQMDSSFRQVMFFRGDCDAITWVNQAVGGTSATGYGSASPLPPGRVRDYTVVTVDYHADNDEYNISFFGTTIPLQALGTVTGTVTFDCALGEVFTATLGGNITLSTPTHPKDGKVYTFILTIDATGGRTITMGANFVKPTLTFTAIASKTNTIVARYVQATNKFYVVSQTAEA